MKRIALLLFTVMMLASCTISSRTISDEELTTLPVITAQTSVAMSQHTPVPNIEQNYTLSLDDIPAYSGSAYSTLNNNVSGFKNSELTTEPFEIYSPLDDLGRCGAAYANICKEIMPTEKRGNIGDVKPSGWHIQRYDFLEDMYLYNRCHLIGYQLAGENANEYNLITGTRYLNIKGMLPFENQIVNYVNTTGHHVLYRATPVFVGNNMLALGVQLEAKSVEDKGEGLEFNVFCYNIQPGVSIDYATGDSWSDGTLEVHTPLTVKKHISGVASAQLSGGLTYILNMNTKKFHYPSCSGVRQIKDKNKCDFTGTRDEVVAQGYSPCYRCKP